MVTLSSGITKMPCRLVGSLVSACVIQVVRYRWCGTGQARPIKWQPQNPRVCSLLFLNPSELHASSDSAWCCY